MFTTDDNKLKISSIIFGIGCIVVLAVLAWKEVLSENTALWVFIIIESVFDIIFPDEVDLSLKHKKRKNWFYTNVIKGRENMFSETLDALIGKQVKIRTLDEVVSGVVKNIDGDFMIIEKQKKNTVETVYVNKNTVETVKIVNQK